MAEPILEIQLLDVPASVAYIGRVATQLRYAVAMALNDTIKDVQAGIQQGLNERFTLRRRSFVERGIKIERGDFATKDKLTARVHLDEDRVAFLRKFEDGGEKRAPDPDLPIAIPSENIRPAFPQLVPLGLYPKSLRLQPRRDVVGILGAKYKITAKGIKQLQGKRRTFVLDPSVHRGVKTWGVYQRTGPGRNDVRLLWTYKTKIPIPAQLRFVETARRVALARWEPNLGRAIARALATAR